MSSKYRQKRDEGFTIIEVLIVLAIAGLIMLVVFLAIPALQRNSRNTQRTNDVANILGGVGEYVSNNNGQLPTSLAVAGTTLTIGTGNPVTVDMGYYSEPASGQTGGVVLASGETSNPGNEELVTIVTGAECDADNNADGGGPSRGYVALYTLENESKQCRES